MKDAYPKHQPIKMAKIQDSDDICPLQFPLITESRQKATKLSDLPKEEREIFIAIKKAIIVEIGGCDVYAAGSRVLGNPHLKGGLANSSDFDVIVPSIPVSKCTDLAKAVTEALQEKYKGVKVDVCASIGNMDKIKL